MANHGVYVFWDNSNIFISAQKAAALKESAMVKRDLRVQFDNLLKLAAAGRPVRKAYCVGSVPPELEAVWKKLTASTGIVPELFERGKGTGTEQSVDQALQVWMLRALADVRPPEVAVLLTGDGAGYDSGAGFRADLERMHKSGWGVEVVSWNHACNAKLKTWATTAGVYVPLEDHYESITFVEGLRKVKPINLTKRASAKPA